MGYGLAGSLPAVIPSPAVHSHCALCSWLLFWDRGANEGGKAKATPLTTLGGLEEGWQRGKIPGSCLCRALCPELLSFCLFPGLEPWWAKHGLALEWQVTQEQRS